jgi:phage recombination protein Bet
MTQQAQPNEDYSQEQSQYQEPARVDGAKLLEELLSRTTYQQKTSYTPFLGTPDNQVTLSPGMVLQFFAKPTKTGQLCTYEQAVRFIMLCKARGLDPREGDAFIVGYDTRNGPEFNLITSHQAFLKRAEANTAYDGMESGVIVQHNETEEVRDIEGDLIPDDCRLIGGWARVHRKDRGHPTYRRLDVTKFNKGLSVWATNPAGMICKCAEADALRATFPNSLAGMYMQGEMQPSATAPAEDTRTAPAPNRAYTAAKKAAAETGPAPAQPKGADVTTGSGGNSPKSATAVNAGQTAEPSAPSNSSFPTKQSVPSPTAAPVVGGRPKPKTEKSYCQNCGNLIAGGKCPECDAVQQVAAESASGNAPNAPSAPPATDPVVESAMQVQEIPNDPAVLAEICKTAAINDPVNFAAARDHLKLTKTRLAAIPVEKLVELVAEYRRIAPQQ